MTHMFDMRCHENGIAHRLTKIKHPWTNGQVERMNRTIKEATVKRYHYDRHEQLESHLADFINAYNYGRRLKTLKGLTPYEFIVKALDKRTGTIQGKPHPSNAGTKHLGASQTKSQPFRWVRVNTEPPARAQHRATTSERCFAHFIKKSISVSRSSELPAPCAGPALVHPSDGRR